MVTSANTGVHVCVLHAGEAVFAIGTAQVREVLDQALPQPVPLAPNYIAGVVAYRGEVLTTVSLRQLLGLPLTHQPGYVAVLDDEDEGACFGLLVDGIGGVVTVAEEAFEPNVQGLDERSAALFDGVYRLDRGLMVRLDSSRLRPAHLAGCLHFSAQKQAQGDGR